MAATATHLAAAGGDEGGSRIPPRRFVLLDLDLVDPVDPVVVPAVSSSSSRRLVVFVVVVGKRAIEEASFLFLSFSFFGPS
jgi:Mrp family chromosome partitioning ATPase